MADSVDHEWIRADSALLPHKGELRRRHRLYLEALKTIEASDGSLESFIVDHGLDYLGLQRVAAGWVFREWAPSATAASLVGDFNQWDVAAHPCDFNENGVWEVRVPDCHRSGESLRVGSRYKVALRYLGGGKTQPGRPHDRDDSAVLGSDHGGAGPGGGADSWRDGGGVGLRADGWAFAMPAWAMQAHKDERSHEVCAVVPRPLHAYPWRHARPAAPPASLRIYEVRALLRCPHPNGELPPSQPRVAPLPLSRARRRLGHRLPRRSSARPDAASNTNGPRPRSARCMRVSRRSTRAWARGASCGPSCCRGSTSSATRRSCCSVYRSTASTRASATRSRPTSPRRSDSALPPSCRRAPQPSAPPRGCSKPS